MYTIDLLNGSGVPVRTGLGKIFKASLAVVVPVAIGWCLTSVFQEHQVRVNILRSQLATVQASVEPLTEALKQRDALERQWAEQVEILDEIRAHLQQHTQWSPAILALGDHLSEALVLTKLEASQGIEKQQVQDPNDPEKWIDRPVVVPELKIGVCGYHGSVSYEAVRDLQSHLRASSLLGPRLAAITISQQSDSLEGKKVVSYELSCRLHPH